MDFVTIRSIQKNVNLMVGTVVQSIHPIHHGISTVMTVFVSKYRKMDWQIIFLSKLDKLIPSLSVQKS